MSAHDTLLLPSDLGNREAFRLRHHARRYANHRRLRPDSGGVDYFVQGQVSEGLNIAQTYLGADPLLVAAVRNEARFLLGGYLA